MFSRGRYNKDPNVRKSEKLERMLNLKILDQSTSLLYDLWFITQVVDKANGREQSKGKICQVWVLIVLTKGLFDLFPCPKPNTMSF